MSLTERWTPIGACGGEPAFAGGCSAAVDEVVLPLPRPLDPIWPPLDEGRSPRRRTLRISCRAGSRHGEVWEAVMPARSTASVRPATFFIWNRLPIPFSSFSLLLSFSREG